MFYGSGIQEMKIKALRLYGGVLIRVSGEET
jgi:hypothetical protein